MVLYGGKDLSRHFGDGGNWPGRTLLPDRADRESLVEVVRFVQLVKQCFVGWKGACVAEDAACMSDMIQSICVPLWTDVLVLVQTGERLKPHRIADGSPVQDIPDAMEEILWVVNIIVKCVHNNLPRGHSEFPEPSHRLLDVWTHADVIIGEADRLHPALRDSFGDILSQEPPIETLIEVYDDLKFGHFIEHGAPIRI